MSTASCSPRGRAIRRTARVVCALALCAPAASAAWAAQGQPAGQQPGAGEGPTTPGTVQAKVEQCVVAVAQGERSATFVGQMTAIAGSMRMSMRIDVQERAPADLPSRGVGGGAFHSLRGPGLGEWRGSADGVKIYRYVRQVTNLSAPGSFRALVRYRWLDEKGRVIRQAQRRTVACDQPDERPKLVVGELRVVPLRAAGQARYEIAVRNEGRAAAGAFEVGLTVNGAVQPSLSVPSLPAGGRALLEATAPLCAAGSTIVVAPDPGRRVEEAAGGGLADSVACPAAATSETSPGGSSTASG